MSTSEFEDRTLSCRDCGNDFLFTQGEQEFYRQKGFTNEPTRCRDCRESRKKRMGGGDVLAPRAHEASPMILFAAVCSACSSSTQVPFEPAPGKPVYCRDCYHLRSRRRDTPSHAVA